MTKIRFYGWVIGMKKIPFIKLLNKKANLSLKESKSIKDRIVNGEICIIEISSKELADEIITESRMLEIKCEVVG